MRRLLRKIKLYLTGFGADKPFEALYDRAKTQTLLPKKKCRVLWQCARQCQSLPGDFAELGVYRGGSAFIVADALTNGKPLHLFDTFTGIPRNCLDRGGCHCPGDFADTSLDIVKRYLGDGGNIVYHQGSIPHTLSRITDARLSFVHCDIDLYKPLKSSLPFIYRRMIPGGIILFDEYGEHLYRNTEKRAVDEFFADKPETPIELNTGQALVVKL